MTRLTRKLRRRLIAPMFSSRKPAEYAARGVLFGVFFAFTPLVGIQIAILLGLWTLVRTLTPKYDFNLIVAIAWVWVTNVFTVPPIYFGFIVTGQMMLGRWNEPIGYSAYTSRLQESLSLHPDAQWYELIWLRIDSLLDAFGLPLFIGWIPWALILSIIGYHWSLKLIRKVRETRAHRRSKKRAARVEKSHLEQRRVENAYADSSGS
ncbi:MAG: DUF2062 domain-containing protein [Alphaproteobacteria bacterium]